MSESVNLWSIEVLTHLKMSPFFRCLGLFNLQCAISTEITEKKFETNFQVWFLGPYITTVTIAFVQL